MQGLAPGTLTLESFDPATSEELGSVPVTAPEQLQAVVEQVADVQPFWAQLPLGDRARYLERAAQVVIDEGDEIRDLIVREQGKPRNEAFSMEVLPSIDALHWIASAGPEILAEERLPRHQLYLRSKRAALVYEPLGVVAVISPWNYPWSIPLGQIAMALMAGNGVVLKPASLTPLVGERIARAFARAGLPEGLLRVVHGPGTGEALVESSVAKVFFTGSVETGRAVAERCARGLKGSVLELGGKDAMVVLEDADLEHALAGALWAGFANAGQSSSGIERVYVIDEIAEQFIAGLVAGARALRVGDPVGWETEIGPMSSREQCEHVRELVDDAVASGAGLLCGGPREGSYFAPAVLTGVRHEMRIMREEIFGPVLAVMTVSSEEEAVALANDSEFGVGASVWTRDRRRGELVAAELQAGTVWINDHVPSRVHTHHHLYECVRPQLRVNKRYMVRDPWWHPYDETLGKALRQGATILYGRPSIRATALRDGLVPLMRLGIRLFAGAHVRRRGAAHAPTPHSSLYSDARPGLHRQRVRVPAAPGDLRPVVRGRHAADALLHRLPAAHRQALRGRRRRRGGAGEDRGALGL
jgi:acyl-CoA reductase-like NAD-dependent aldehyde dehydrogenase